MNERIFELCIQAKREFDEHVAECEQLGKQIEWVTEERLVELVVRECAYVSEGYFGFKDHTPGTAIAKEMKEHFGVGE